MGQHNSHVSGKLEVSYSAQCMSCNLDDQASCAYIIMCLTCCDALQCVNWLCFGHPVSFSPHFTPPSLTGNGQYDCVRIVEHC